MSLMAMWVVGAMPPQLLTLKLALWYPAVRTALSLSAVCAVHGRHWYYVVYYVSAFLFVYFKCKVSQDPGHMGLEDRGRPERRCHRRLLVHLRVRAGLGGVRGELGRHL